MKERRWRRGEVVETEPSPQSVEVWWHYLFTAPADPSSRACSSDIYHHVYSINVIYISSCWRTRVTQCASPCLQTYQWKIKNKKQTIEFSSPQGSVLARGEIPALVKRDSQSPWSSKMEWVHALGAYEGALTSQSLELSPPPRQWWILDRSSRGRSWRIHKLVVVLAQYQVLSLAQHVVLVWGWWRSRSMVHEDEEGTATTTTTTYIYYVTCIYMIWLWWCICMCAMHCLVCYRVKVDINDFY